MEELSGVLWDYRTIPRRPTGNTPFALAYEINAVIPTEISIPIARTAVQGQRDEGQELERHLDWANKVRESVTIRMTSYHQRVVAYYNQKV